MITRKLLLRFAKTETERPIIYHLVKEFDLVINIFRARVTSAEEGFLVLDVTGEESAIERGMASLAQFNVTVDPVNKGVRWDADKCTHCGNCVPHCPTDALHIPDRKTMRIAFDEEACIECLACLKNCPFGACASTF